MSSTTVSNTVTRINNPTLTSLSERITATQTLIDLHEKIRNTHKTTFKKHVKNINAGLDKGGSAIHNTMAMMDQSIEIQKMIVGESEEMVKYARELVELMEERQEVIRGLMGEEGEVAY